MRKLRKMKLMELYTVAIFVIFLLLAIVFAIAFPNMKVYGDYTMLSISIVLLLI